jgi:hypothetical protein
MASTFIDLPATGIPSVPTAADLPAVGSPGQVYIAVDTGAIYGWSVTNQAWETGGTGTVSSVAMTVPSFLTVSGSPITTTGTLAVTATGVLPVANATIGAQTLTESGGATTVTWSNGNLFILTLSANLIVSFSGATSGQNIQVALTNTAGYTVTWPTVRWAGGTPPVQSVAFTDVYTFLYDGTYYYGTAVQNMS